MISGMVIGILMRMGLRRKVWALSGLNFLSLG